MKFKYSVSDILIKDINVVFIEDFLLYIKNNYRCSHNTAMKFVQRFRTVVNFAKNTGLVTADPFGNYRVRFERTDRDYLTMEEITAIYNHKFSTKRLNQVRDLFIFSCYTALSYIDVCELRQETFAPDLTVICGLYGKNTKQMLHLPSDCWIHQKPYWKSTKTNCQTVRFYQLSVIRK